ncbi:DUF3362 domain-containing protein [Planctomyces sp. SH-PL62]|uniref:DUF3362 domain-containing protein n=1 Tax=Planctomyces sp. SH-PL62 TaxID=1636152 RepID=UPI0012E77A12|nr:DUF3362 domain-containing protein [Planctomyces sp. SH-PL62]
MLAAAIRRARMAAHRVTGYCGMTIVLTQIGKLFDIAACMSCTGKDPFAGREAYAAQHLRDRKLQRASLQCFRPEDDFEGRKALPAVGREDLIGGGALQPPDKPTTRSEAPDTTTTRPLPRPRRPESREGGEVDRTKARAGEAARGETVRTRRCRFDGGRRAERVEIARRPSAERRPTPLDDIHKA